MKTVVFLSLLFGGMFALYDVMLARYFGDESVLETLWKRLKERK